MSYIRISRRIQVQPLLKREDVEAIYRDILAGGLGGDTYNLGVLTSTNGALDHRNFALHAGFTNDNKTPNTSIFPVQLRIAAPTGTASYRASMPFTDDLVSPAFRPNLIRWTLSFGNSGPSTGTAKLFYTYPGSTEAQAGAAAGQSWSAAAALSIIANETLTSTPLPAQTQFRMELAITSGTAKDFVALLWFRFKHVR